MGVRQDYCILKENHPLGVLDALVVAMGGDPYPDDCQEVLSCPYCDEPDICKECWENGCICGEFTPNWGAKAYPNGDFWWWFPPEF